MSQPSNGEINADCHPLCSFGVITDIHYADADDCTNYEGTRMRSFRRSLQLVETAVSEWVAGDNPVHFILQLGDLIDGRNSTLNASDAALGVVIQQFSRLPQPVYHILGNHELYNFSRAQLLHHHWLSPSPSVVTPQPGHTAHYHFSPVKGFRVVILDQYEFSMLGYKEDDETYRQAINLEFVYLLQMPLCQELVSSQILLISYSHVRL